MNRIFKTVVQCVHRSLELPPSVSHATDQIIDLLTRAVGQVSPSRCALIRSTEPVLSIFRKILLTELTTHFFRRHSVQIRVAPHPFSCLRSLIKHFFVREWYIS